MKIFLIFLYPLLGAALQWQLCVWADKRPALKILRYLLMAAAVWLLLGYSGYLVYKYMQTGSWLPVDALLVGMLLMLLLTGFCVIVLYSAYCYVDKHSFFDLPSDDKDK